MKKHFHFYDRLYENGTGINYILLQNAHGVTIKVAEDGEMSRFTDEDAAKMESTGSFMTQLLDFNKAVLHKLIELGIADRDVIFSGNL
jgi:hypothetical protein